MKRGQQGFSLVTAIFLLVVLATLMGYMVSLSVVQHTTIAMSVQGARALQAARAGLEYAVFQALGAAAPAWCASTPDSVGFTAAEPALQSFSVSLSCSSSDHIEGGETVTFYELTALAEKGAFAQGSAANPDYVSRRLRVTVSREPP